MRNSADVIAQAVDRKGPDIAEALDMSVSRFYEFVSTDNPLPKFKRLVHGIAKVNLDGVWLIKADVDAMFLDILEDAGEVTIAELHKESSEAVQSALNNDPLDVQIRETREAIAAKQRHLISLEKQKLGFSATDEVAQRRARKVGGRR